MEKANKNYLTNQLAHLLFDLTDPIYFLLLNSFFLSLLQQLLEFLETTEIEYKAVLVFLTGSIRGWGE